jgi:hypothetical protein
MPDPLPNRAKNNKKGKALRARVPRETHAELHGPLDRDAVAGTDDGVRTVWATVSHSRGL